MSTRASAIRRYQLFNGLEPREEGEFPSLRMPTLAHYAGAAIEVMYRSAKRDPATDRVPSKAVNYIHDHGAGVGYYRTDGGGRADKIAVPQWLRRETHLVLIGEFLGAAYRDGHDDEIEVKVSAPKPTLFCVPSGKALVVVDEFRPKIVALIWGGRLGVFRRGIVG